MKTKTKIKLITILIAVLACALIAGCQVGRETYGQFVDRNGLSCHITYMANGGLFETNQSIKEVYYKPDAYAINIGVTDIGNSKMAVHRDGYVLKGWCYALSENGNPVYEDDAKTIVETGSEFEFAKKLQSGTEVTLYASWVLDVQIEIRLAGIDRITVQDGENTKTVNSGEELTRETFGKDMQKFIQDRSPVESTDSTFLQFFTDAQCIKPFDGLARKPEEENAPNVVIYAKYMPGKYTVVKDAAGAQNMFALMGGTTKYYIYNDIDMKGAAVPQIYSTGCSIEGNGNVTISNFKTTVTNITGGSYALFGNFYQGAGIKNVTFDNIEVSYTVRAGSQTNPRIVKIYGICSDIADGVTFENAVISNLKVSINPGENVQIDNLFAKEGYRTDNWLFGREAGANQTYTDAQFRQTYTGLTVKDSSLTISGKTVATVD